MIMTAYSISLEFWIYFIDYEQILFRVIRLLTMKVHFICHILVLTSWNISYVIYLVLDFLVFHMLYMWGSDHGPVLADILSNPARKKKTFKFDKWWLEDEKIRQVILAGLDSSDLPHDANIMDHISCCRKALSQWKRERDLNTTKLVEDLKAKVNSM